MAERFMYIIITTQITVNNRQSSAPVTKIDRSAALYKRAAYIKYAQPRVCFKTGGMPRFLSKMERIQEKRRRKGCGLSRIFDEEAVPFRRKDGVLEF